MKTRILITLATALLASCATSPRAPVVTAPPRAIKVQPLAAKVRESIRATDKQVATIQREAVQAAGEATAARVEAERLKDKQAATADELTGIWQSLKSVEARNLFLEKETNNLATKLSAMTSEASQLEQIASAKDSEASTLRTQNEDGARTIVDLNKQLDTQGKALVKAQAAASSAGVYRTWCIVGAALVVILGGGLIYLKALTPRIPLLT